MLLGNRVKEGDVPIMHKLTAIGVAAVFLTACGDDDTTGATTTTLPATSTTVAARSISGNVTYAGTALDGHRFVIAVNRQGDDGPPAYSATLAKAGPFTISDVEDGSYTVIAFIDLGDDMGSPEADEPTGTYDTNADGNPDLVVVSQGAAVTGIDVVVSD